MEEVGDSRGKKNLRYGISEEKFHFNAWETISNTQKCSLPF